LERTWLVPAFVLVALQQAACLALGIWFHIAGRPPFINYGLVALSLLSVVVALLLIHASFLTFRERAASPLAYLWDYFFVRRSRLAVFLFGFTLAWLQLVALTWTKSLIPHVTTMWADPLLADADFWLFGVDPWRLVDPFLAPVGQVIDGFYAFWILILQLTFAAALFTRPSALKSRVFITFFVAMALVGVFGQFVLPSGGPIFWSRLGFGHRFDALPSAPHTRLAADYLWRKYLGESVDFATGISAFPSMHVTMTAWIVLTVHALFPKWLRPFAWAYFLVILTGSVYLGWHYLMDGLGGVIGAIGSWYLAGAIVRKLRSPDRVREFPSLVSI